MKELYNDTIELLKKLADSQKAKGNCPSCGYCSACGRSNTYRGWGTYPYYPSQPYITWGQGGTLTGTSGYAQVSGTTLYKQSDEQSSHNHSVSFDPLLATYAKGEADDA